MYVVLEFVRDSPSHAIFVVRKYCCPSFAIAILLCVCVCDSPSHANFFVRTYCRPSSTIAILLCKVTLFYFYLFFSKSPFTHS